MSVTFVAETHQYFTEEGRELPSVTTVLKRAGLLEDRYWSDEAANFGSYGHEVLCALLRDELEGYDRQFEPWMVGIRAFVRDMRPRPYVNARAGIDLSWKDSTERIVWAHDYAGTFDFFGNIEATRFPVICDWKFWSSATSYNKAIAGLQTAGYASALKTCDRRFKLINIHRYVMHFFPGGYHPHPLERLSDFIAFQSAVNLVSWKAENI